MPLKMNIQTVTICLLLCLQAEGYAQSQRPLILNDIEKNGQIEIVQPAQMEFLLNMQTANNALQKGIQGYRIRIFSQSGQSARDNAIAARASFMKNLSGPVAYLLYNEPNFQVFVGDFRTEIEARRQRSLLLKKFPGAFIVKTTINIQ
ncbi:MAG: hypothetical protein LBS09_09150 [Bacteroidales bacterium]|jgi:hypothetical protein|nr:hypothetical protein [Bacteroidales bacterium]